MHYCLNSLHNIQRNVGMAAPLKFSEYQYEKHALLLSIAKLKSAMRTSTLMAGFALVAMVEVELEPNTPTALLVPFAMHTALLICVHLFSLMLATRLLPELEAISAHPYLNPAVVKLAKSWPVQLCWVLSNIVGIALFVVELVLVAYVKFYPASDGMEDRLHAGTGTLAIVVFLSFLIVPFIVIFFRSISKLQIKLHEQRLERARVMLDNINQTAAPLDMDSVMESGSVASYHTIASQEPAQCVFPTYTEV